MSEYINTTIMARLLCFATVCLLFACTQPAPSHTTWKVYGGSKENLHYSGLHEIDTGNVTQLQPAWIFHTGDADTAKFSQIQCNPIIVDSVMYAVSPSLRLFAVHAGNGNKIWSFDPNSLFENPVVYNFSLNNCRGVTYWTDGNNDKRILYVAGSFVHCINAVTGNLVTSFADSGIIGLHNDLERDVKDLFVTSTSPGIIYKDLYIVGTRVDEGPAAAPGHIRAYDVKSGKLKWIFHTIPQPGEYGYETWEDSIAYKHVGGANSWSGFSMDEKRGILFAPTGSASFDFYGGRRKGQDLFANCLLALDAATGKRIWHYQFIHHDVWDWDVPCAPVLITIKKDGKEVDAVAQVTKHGMVWIFDRETGKPLHAVNEMSVDTANALPGEKLSPTQPISAFTKPFVRQGFTDNDLNPYLADTTLAKLRNDLQHYDHGKMFIVPGEKTRVQLPGFDGGAEWGGPSYDPETGMLYVNANEMSWLVTLRKVEPREPKKETYGEAGLRLYQQHCVSCHGIDRKGTGNYPTLINVNTKYTTGEVLELLKNGRRMMPSFNYVSDEEKKAIISYVLESKADQKKEFVAPLQPVDTFRNLPYRFMGYIKFLAPGGYPALSPPWGTLTAIDMNNGDHKWKTTLGEYPELKAKGIPPTGTENYGGSVVTAGGLLFIAAAKDGKLRAFNKRSGELLWEYELPAAAFATPSVYELNGKQYIVIACGGGKLGAKSSDVYIAFSLPDKK